MAEDIRILIVDDHAIVREGQRALIETEAGLQVLGEAKNGDEAVEMAHALQPDVILMDLQMPGKDGIEAIKEIKTENPDAHILVLTSFSANFQSAFRNRRPGSALIFTVSRRQFVTVQG